jgi:hypothetical protein
MNQLRLYLRRSVYSLVNLEFSVRLVRADVEQGRLLFGVSPHFVHFIYGDFAAFGFFLAALGAALDFFALFLLAGLFLLALVEC